jgi:microcompartment protein CcmK/EutM
MFLLVDGSDYSGANAKNCSAAFDKLGHGAVVCAGSSITAAWQEEHSAQVDAVTSAVQAAEREKDPGDHLPQ